MLRRGGTSLRGTVCGTSLRPCLRQLQPSRHLRTTPPLRANYLCGSSPTADLHQLALAHLPGLLKLATVSPPSSLVLLSSSARLQSQTTVYEPASGPAGATPGGSEQPGEPASQESQGPTAAKAKAVATEEGGWLRFLLPLLDLGLLLAGALCTLGAVAIAVSLPARSALLIKAASSGALTLRGVVSVLGAVQLQATLRVLASLFLITAGDRTKRRLKHELFRAVLAQELGFVSDMRPSGLVATLSEDTDKVGRAVAMQLSLAVNSVGGVVGGIHKPPLTPTLTLTLTPTLNPNPNPHPHPHPDHSPNPSPSRHLPALPAFAAADGAHPTRGTSHRTTRHRRAPLRAAHEPQGLRGRCYANYGHTTRTCSMHGLRGRCSASTRTRRRSPALTLSLTLRRSLQWP